MSDIRSMIIALGYQLSEEDNAAHDLWSWLPSYQVAQKHHGDYAGNHRPSVHDVMIEAALYLGHLKNPGAALAPEEREWFERCPCDGDHGDAND